MKVTKIKIALILALGVALPTQSCFADNVSGLTQFFVNQRAMAGEVNTNFNEVKRAVDDNFARLKTHEALSHGGGTGNSTGVSIGGNGVSGDLNVKTNEDWNTETASIKNSTFNWLICNIGDFANAGTQVVLTVPSGTTIRCKNNFTLFSGAKIVISSGYGSGFTNLKGIPATAIRSSLHSIPLGGAGTYSGGYIRIVSDGAITIDGTIEASGLPGVMQGHAAGGGGVVLLESSTEITVSNTATISANGGVGAGAKNVGYQEDLAPSGSGGGGIIALLAPVITSTPTTTATITVNGGAAVAGGGNQSTSPGTTGLSSGGTGGKPFSYLSSKATAGTKGHIIEMIVNPTTMVP